ncbi:DUF3618 domain-containing protein [Microbacterium sp. T2.11-28]|uniref:DUF3618 domain-containing protein n=1 Tax=Microbacterium sp. T2.11-28 TaxID=3041169 RepID=UPI0024773106|nr:DUF3618 domain-containing protein [Microbacterium sp. T2.11-28]CAI9390262.1 hypothetical protein MICABA_01394 [Microbacterium sp. T2.11-28]
MTDSPDEIRAEIERTRRELGSDVDALADKVSPSKAVDRQMAKVRGAFGSVRERVMGAADDAGSSLSDAADHVGDAKDRVVSTAQGNPLAVGLIALGAGLLVASLIPASAKEKDLAAQVKEGAQPLVDELADVAKDVGEHLKDPAQQAVDAVTHAAQDSAAVVTEDARYASDKVRDQAEQSRDNLAG